jgi:uncharacterized protein (DUF885 family)
MQSRLLLYLSWFSLVLSASILRVSANDEDARLAAAFKSYLEETLPRHPLEATGLGDHRFDHLLDDLSSAALAADREHTRQTLTQLPSRVDYAKLSRAAQVDYEIWRQNLKKNLWSAENSPTLEQDPRAYNAYINESVFLLLTQSTLPRETNLANAIARIKLIPTILKAARENLKQPLRTHTETAIRQNRGAINFYDKEIFQMVGKTKQTAALKAAAHQAVESLRAHQQFLEKDALPRATDNWRLGKAKFAQKFELEMDAGLSADQVLAEAETEFNRVQNDMYVIARQLWGRYYPLRPLPPTDSSGRVETIRQVIASLSQNHSTGASVVNDIKKTVKEIKGFIRTHQILTLPEPDRCRIIEMPEFQRGNSTAYMNSPPPLDPTAIGHYAVSPPPRDWDAAKVKSFFEEYNYYQLHVLTIHEAYPGHYVQFEYSNRNPSLIRRVLPSGVYVEGWAVYTEQTLLDQGYGSEDPAMRLAALKFYLRAVGNTILDHKMHCTSMSDAEALEFLTRQAYQSEGEARLKVIRSQQSSVQLSTYFVGRMAHVRTRQEIQRAAGEKFNLARYHEAVLNEGAVPMRLLPELVRMRVSDMLAH